MKTREAMGHKSKKSPNEPWIDGVVLGKMQAYDISDSCMFHSDENFVSFEASKTDKQKSDAYRYFNSKLIQILDLKLKQLDNHSKYDKFCAMSSLFLSKGASNVFKENFH